MFAGPYEGWQQKLQNRAAELKLESKVTWTGMLSGAVKWGAFTAAEVFVLPSHTESFGAAVVEAMACGVPVLISDKVKIWPEIQATGAAFVAKDDLSGTTQLLKRWLQLPPVERESMRRRAQEGYDKVFVPRAALERLVSVLRAFGAQDGAGNGRSY